MKTHVYMFYKTRKHLCLCVDQTSRKPLIVEQADGYCVDQQSIIFATLASFRYFFLEIPVILGCCLMVEEVSASRHP